MAESAREHTIRTGHSTQQWFDLPWTCDDCPARAAMHDLTVTHARASEQGEPDV